MDNPNSTTKNDVVIRFSGDSGDGMQLAGTLFSNLSAILGNEIATFPDYPAEIRAPQGTESGVSGFQVHIGSGIKTPGDEADVLVAMNPAALKVNAHLLKPLSVVIFDTDTFTAKDLEKAGFSTDNPFAELSIEDSVQLVPVPLSNLTVKSLEGSGMDLKTMQRSKNMFALGLICWLFNRELENAIHFLENKFGKKPEILEANSKVLTDGYNYGHNLHLNISTFVVNKSEELPKGTYTIISGNKATALGFIAAAEKSGLQLFLGSYPITPASDILHELAARKDLGVKTFQAEDEIAGICTALGASFAGSLAVTSTSGPGLALKSEALGLAVIAELPLVLVDVMRGGPSTGLPTKTEQTDLLQALYGRNGESPIVVIAASTPDNSFLYAYMSAKIALEYQTPVILLTDAFTGNGSSLWKLPKLSELPDIKPLTAPEKYKNNFNAATRNEETKVRYRAFPSMEGFEHRNGGLEKDCNTAAISTDGANHAKMVNVRAAKIENVANSIPLMTVEGNPDAELLVIGWGSTYGHLQSAVTELNRKGEKCALLHFNYINPMPKNAEEIIRKYGKVVVCELNSGQLASYLRTKVQGVCFRQINKIEAQPFSIGELVEQIELISKNQTSPI
ncbi:MAG: 2-oxoacid:acceptor oxidoreductase subunit alpha [Prevotellaceae bacterium]|jgi:2-oxoglutarate ferredoxin oxidoreductase subunit alpha|nr:2-oxoacid:acceptor oxidoreductase subunit alpha [Prevotellaceae bacterium]